jgi:hypothetical protein
MIKKQRYTVALIATRMMNCMHICFQINRSVDLTPVSLYKPEKINKIVKPNKELQK